MTKEKILKKLLDEVLEDIDLFGINQLAVLFYKNKIDGKHFSDYDVIDLKNDIPIYDDETAEAITLKELLYIVADLLYPNVSDEILVIYINMFIKNYMPYTLAKEVNIKLSLLMKMLNNEEEIPEELYKKIAEILNFDMEEYFRIRSNYKFDETDL